LADLDRLVSERFNLPLRPYSTDIRAALELVVWHLENSESEWPVFEVSCSPYSEPDEPFIASFEKDSWISGKTAPLSICNSALRFLKEVRVVFSENE
ncbi:MAG TPA: hypothetical protein DCP31_16395, partial [Cyanobacteria bacterium UBA8543]|nr:hypothetical protein [Cyanobacteria bacterium UBA8543]